MQAGRAGSAKPSVILRMSGNRRSWEAFFSLGGRASNAGVTGYGSRLIGEPGRTRGRSRGLWMP